MQIEVGKTYQTREGGTAQISAIHEDEPIYQICGRLTEPSGAVRCAFWTLAGQYVAGRNSAFDLQP